MNTVFLNTLVSAYLLFCHLYKYFCQFLLFQLSILNKRYNYNKINPKLKLHFGRSLYIT